MSTVETVPISYPSAESGFFGDEGAGLVSTGVTPGVYGDATNVAQITVNSQGQITSVVDVPVAVGFRGYVTWTLTVNRAVLSGNDLNFNTIKADSGAIIDEVAAGTEMTISETGLYFVALTLRSGTNAADAWLRVNGVNEIKCQYHAVNRSCSACGLFSLNAGQIISARAAANFTATGAATLNDACFLNVGRVG